jgi:CheY-like chemotaxis protein
LAKDKAETAQRVSEAANRAKSTFLANMSHELRTPLNAILGFSQLMTRDPLISADQLNKLSIINRSGEHLLMLINDVLDMSKIEAGRATLELSGFDLHRTLATVEEMSVVRAEGKQLTFKVERAAHLPIYIKTDERKLRQVLLNLLSNAVKFTEVGGVTLRVAPLMPKKKSNSSRVHLQFEVEDTGPGIAEHELEYIFDPFIQADTGQQNQQEGTGLGLAISRQFIRLMQGDITVTSILGKGSVFTFDIQVEAADIGQVGQQHIQRRVIGISSDITSVYRVLIVDDNVLNRSLLSNLLIPVGFEMREAVNGQEAVKIAVEWQPHFIWMDMRMPVMDGYAATQAIRSLSSAIRTVPIIALTASAFEENREQMLTAGCNDFMRKPFKEQDLFDKMAEYLEIEYLYEEQVDTPPRAQDGKQEKKGTKVFAALPQDILSSLEEAAVSGNLEMIEEVAEEIRRLKIDNVQHNEIANQIVGMAQNFKYKELWTMIQEIKGA